MCELTLRTVIIAVAVVVIVIVLLLVLVVLVGLVELLPTMDYYYTCSHARTVVL